MKILHIDTGREWRGGQRQAMFLHQGLMEAGFESYLVCNADGQFPKKNVDNLIPIKFKGEADISFLRELKKAIRQIKPDIVQTHDAHSLTPALLAKVLGARFKLINTRRVDFSVNKGYIKRKKYDNKQINCIVAISRAIRDMLVEDGIPAEKIKLINSGVRFPKSIDYEAVIDIRKKYDLDGKYVVGNVANRADHKDHFTLIDAFSQFWQVSSGSVLMIVGDGPMEKEVKEYAAAQRCADSIIFTGYTDKVYEHIAVFDLFCMSSKTEGLCTSIIDAMFMMKPVAATSAGGIPELVKNNFNGRLSPVQNAGLLMCSLFEICHDEKMAKKMGENGFHTALKFSDGAMVIKYIKLYSELLGYSLNSASR